MDKFIVAEITKNWDIDSPLTHLIGQQFEKVINVNHERGYLLKEWKLTSIIHRNHLTETIIAIFEVDPKIVW